MTIALKPQETVKVMIRFIYEKTLKKSLKIIIFLKRNKFPLENIGDISLDDFFLSYIF